MFPRQQKSEYTALTASKKLQNPTPKSIENDFCEKLVLAINSIQKRWFRSPSCLGPQPLVFKKLNKNPPIKPRYGKSREMDKIWIFWFWPLMNLFRVTRYMGKSQIALHVLTTWDFPQNPRSRRLAASNGATTRQTVFQMHEPLRNKPVKSRNFGMPTTNMNLSSRNQWCLMACVRFLRAWDVPGRSKIPYELIQTHTGTDPITSGHSDFAKHPMESAWF